MLRFSIVIPTRNRAYTLFYTLKSCLNQKEFDDYEIIVSDNCSEDNTAEMIKQFHSKKIKYYKTDSPLAMTDNFNYAISKASGEYVLFIGSDDAINTYGLYLLDKILEITGEPIIKWAPGYYFWPDHIPPFGKSFLVLPDNSGEVVCITQAEKNIREILNYSKNPTIALPHIFVLSVAHKDLVAELKERTGVVFDSTSPDQYFGFAISAIIEKHTNIGIPVCCIGTSGKSNGALQMYKGSASSEAAEFNNLNALNNRLYRGSFTRAGVNAVIDSIIMDDFVCAKTNLNAFPDIEINFSKHISAIIKECYNKYKYYGENGKTLLQEKLSIIEKVISNDPMLRACFDGKGLDIDDYDFYSPDQYTAFISGNSIQFDTSLFGVDNIYDATLLAEKLLYNKKYIDKYISRFKENWFKIIPFFEKLRKCKRFGLFATGRHTERFLELFQSYCCNDKVSIALFDNDKAKWGTRVCGIDVLPPHVIPEQGLDALIISSYLHQTEIYESIKHYSDIVNIIRLYGKDSEGLPLPSMF